MKEVKVIFEGKTQTNLTYEEAVEAAQKIVYEHIKKYALASTGYGYWTEQMEKELQRLEAIFAEESEKYAITHQTNERKTK